MTNTIRKVLVTISLPGIFIVTALSAAPSWTLAGLQGENINVILPMTGFGGEALMVGSDKGIWWYQSGYWDMAWTGLPVHDMATTADGIPVAVAGNGSDSDGVYLGKITGIAKRAGGGSGFDTWWGFTFQQRYHVPAAVALQRPLDSNCGSVFVGDSAGVAAGQLCNGSVGELTALPGPTDPFGSLCASLMVYSVDNMLYAGGNNDYRNVSIVAPIDTSWLIRGTTELTRFKRLSVTSLVELHTQKDILIGGDAPSDYSPDVKLIAAATIDSGIKLFEGDYLYGELSSPVGGEPVVSIVPFTKVRTFTGFSLTMLAAATPSGVFLQCSPDQNCLWSKLGELPYPPTCLAQYNETTLWAGTESGLYRYEISPVALYDSNEHFVSDKHTTIPIRSGKGALYFNHNLPDGCLLTLFDSRGRCVKKRCVSEKNTVITNIGKGMYLYRLQIGNRAIATGRVACY